MSSDVIALSIYLSTNYRTIKIELSHSTRTHIGDKEQGVGIREKGKGIREKGEGINYKG